MGIGGRGIVPGRQAAILIKILFGDLKTQIIAEIMTRLEHQAAPPKLVIVTLFTAIVVRIPVGAVIIEKLEIIVTADIFGPGKKIAIVFRLMVKRAKQAFTLKRAEPET